MDDALRLPELRGINRGLRVLLVEDSETDASIIQDILERDKRIDCVRHAHDGEEALGKLEEGLGPDLIITDMKMPVKDGFEFLIALRTWETANDPTDDDDIIRIPVVVLTSSDRAIDFHKATLAQANCFVTKPSSLAQLKDVLRRIVHSMIWAGELPRMLTAREEVDDPRSAAREQKDRVA